MYIYIIYSIFFFVKYFSHSYIRVIKSSKLSSSTFKLPLRSQVPDRQHADEELWHHLLQRGLLRDVWLQPRGDHAAALYLPVPGGPGDHEDRHGPTGPGPAGLRGTQGGDPLLR